MTSYRDGASEFVAIGEALATITTAIARVRATAVVTDSDARNELNRCVQASRKLLRTFELLRHGTQGEP